MNKNRISRNKRFGAIVFALTQDNLCYIPDEIDSKITGRMEDLMPQVQDVGIKGC